MDKYDAVWKDLAPRDVVARAIYQEMLEHDVPYVYLNLRDYISEDRMNFDLDDNQLMFRDTVERFCAPVDVARRHTMRRMDGGFDRNRWKDLADLGLVALALSESDGGLGGSLLDCAIVAQAMGRGLAGSDGPGEPQGFRILDRRPPQVEGLEVCAGLALSRAEGGVLVFGFKGRKPGTIVHDNLPCRWTSSVKAR
jgi:hypothetical protein